MENEVIITVKKVKIVLISALSILTVVLLVWAIFFFYQLNQKVTETDTGVQSIIKFINTAVQK